MTEILRSRKAPLELLFSTFIMVLYYFLFIFSAYCFLFNTNNRSQWHSLLRSVPALHVIVSVSYYLYLVGFFFVLLDEAKKMKLTSNGNLITNYFRDVNFRFHCTH